MQCFYFIKKMKLLVVLACVLACSCALTVEEQWEQFKIEHGKTYKSLLEEKSRFAIFKDRLLKNQEHNERFARGEVLYSLGVNRFSDMTDEEFRATLSPMPPLPEDFPRRRYNGTKATDNEPINWVEKGVVTSVKDQLKCGACWAFSVAGSIEAQVAIQGGALVSLSAQNLVDCYTMALGCSGGDPFTTYYYIEEFGIKTEAEYPYVGKAGPCKGQGGQKVSGFMDLDHDEESLFSALKANGPISAEMDAAQLAHYSGGIYDSSSGCWLHLNHAVLVVGAGTENGVDYWLIKNSWGQKWGLEGYFKLIRNQQACGIHLRNAYPLL